MPFNIRGQKKVKSFKSYQKIVLDNSTDHKIKKLISKYTLINTSCWF